jgi:hypothetical protein
VLYVEVAGMMLLLLLLVVLAGIHIFSFVLPC